MSTKIYNGYLIKGINTFPEFEEFRKQITFAAKQTQGKLATRLIINTAVGMVDAYQVGFDVNKSDDIVFNSAYQSVQEKLRNFKTGPYRHPAYDLRFEAVVFLAEKMLAIVIGDNTAMQNIFKTHPRVEEYAYWDNADHPDNLTDEQWEQRRKDWNFIEGPICNNGIVMMVDDYIPIEKMNIDTFSVKDYVNLETRANSLAKKVIYKKFDDGEIEIELPEDPVQRVMKISEWMNEGEGKPFFIEMTEFLKQNIKEDLSFKDIFETKFIDFPRIGVVGAQTDTKPN